MQVAVIVYSRCILHFQTTFLIHKVYGTTKLTWPGERNASRRVTRPLSPFKWLAHLPSHTTPYRPDSAHENVAYGISSIPALTFAGPLMGSQAGFAAIGKQPLGQQSRPSGTPGEIVQGMPFPALNAIWSVLSTAVWILFHPWLPACCSPPLPPPPSGLLPLYIHLLLAHPLLHESFLSVLSSASLKVVGPPFIHIAHFIGPSYHGLLTCVVPFSFFTTCDPCPHHWLQ